MNSNLSYRPETLNSGQNRRFIVPSDLEIWWMTVKNNKAPLLCCFKLYASFHSHQWIQTEVTVRKRSIRVKIGDLLSRMTLKFDGWPWKTIRHLFYVASSFMHHFIAISEFKLKLHDIDYIEYVGPSLTWGSILSTCIKSMWRNDIKSKYMFMFPLKNSARKGLRIPEYSGFINRKMNSRERR